MAKSRSEKDKRYEERHKEERKAKNVILGNKRSESVRGRNRRFFEKTPLYEGKTH